MKVLILNSSDINGGAARAAYRLHNALLNNNIESFMLVQSKFSNAYNIIGPQNKIQKIFSKINPFLNQIQLRCYPNKKSVFSSALFSMGNIIQKINDIQPDIVHLHWICSNMISINEISKIKYPIVWSLHDMWPFTGGCHYDENCGLYKTECKNCKVLKSFKKNDLSKKIWSSKMISYSKISNLTIVGLSRWITSEAKKSTLFKNRNIINLPNLIDTDIFKPINKNISRNLLNLSQDKKIILFTAISATSDKRKGFKELCNAINKVKTKNIELAILGSYYSKIPLNFSFVVHYLGDFHDEISLQLIYSACDVVVVPSLQENLSNVIMESLSCGTPVTAFDIGGNSDMITHKINGYLANAYDTTDLAFGIDWILNHDNYNELMKNARKKIIKNYSNHIVVKKYINLYKELIKI